MFTIKLIESNPPQQTVYSAVSYRLIYRDNEDVHIVINTKSNLIDDAGSETIIVHKGPYQKIIYIENSAGKTIDAHRISEDHTALISEDE